MKCERGVIAGFEMALIVMVCLLAAGALAPLGCAGSPVQKPTQTITPDSATAAKLTDVQAQVLSLAQQNTAIINAIQKSAQDADQFRTEVKGSVASLTQNQFRIESWLAEGTDHWYGLWPRFRLDAGGVCGVGPVDAGHAGGDVVGKSDSVPGIGNGHGSGGGNSLGSADPHHTANGEPVKSKSFWWSWPF